MMFITKNKYVQFERHCSSPPMVINIVFAFVRNPKLFFVEKSISDKSGKVFNTVTCIAKQIFA